MRITKQTALLALVATMAVGCVRDPHFITDAEYRTQVQADYNQRTQALGYQWQGIDTLKRAEREAMQFLYAYMPLSDVADYTEAFFLQQVRTAFEARSTMPWGKQVPEDVFRHFVLVYRVNNENLDTARTYFYHQLRQRVQGMSMEEAALEVNHWCHEHVAYRASDARTSAPLSTMRTSLGRCGEESTFAVTALRAVGIPARQCYTPRWAHCDDNHAWVEVWVDGQWKFLGACEPDPRLDMGWFSVPSTRCMMVHSKAFGRYRGDEEVVRRTAMYSELNLLSHYAPTRRVKVEVRNADGTAAQGAQVKFKLYNYAEYYTLATQTADQTGCAYLTTGLGDLLVWATDGQQMAFDKIDVRQDSTMLLTLSVDAQQLAAMGVVEYEMVPPAAGRPKVVATEAELAANAVRLDYEDSVRAAYTATFHTNSPNPFVRRSEGNYAEIERFVGKHPSADAYLASYSHKDMRDITYQTLEAHYTEAENFALPIDVYQRGIMPARISNEMVRPYRAELAVFAGYTADSLHRWVEDSIFVDDTSNYFNCPISPVGVYRLRHADAHSRDIFYVAACRAAGIPAYLDGATEIIYTYHHGAWHNSTFQQAADAQAEANNAQLTLTYRGTSPAKPVYYPHYTLQKLYGGDMRTFDFEDDPRLANLPATIGIEPGVYCLSTGNRYADGSVRSRIEFFEVGASQKLQRQVVILPLLPRTDQLGTVDKDIELYEGVELWDYAGTAGMLYINLGEYSEPSKHLVVELRNMQKEMADWGGMTFMVGPTGIGMADWHLVNTDLAYQKGLLEQRIQEATKADLAGNYPLVALIDNQGHILYHSQGYKIGAVEQVLKAAMVK